ncbi:MAG: hypothetical protein WAM78_15060, partial [Candidatus Sulfotelmatobacter sp.]
DEAGEVPEETVSAYLAEHAPEIAAEQATAVAALLNPVKAAGTASAAGGVAPGEAVAATGGGAAAEAVPADGDEAGEVPEETVSAYLAEHAPEIAAEQEKPFQPVGGIVDLLGANYFPVSENKSITEIAEAEKAAEQPAGAAVTAAALAKPGAPPPGKRDNAMQKIGRLDVKGRIQLALKGNKEERSLLIRDGTKVVALAVLEAPKLSDGEVEKFALQKNVLEAVLRQIPLKRRFMKNYIVVRNLVSNPRTPLDLGLGLMKHLQPQDLKNISANKEVSETVRKLALKMYKQKLDAANKK